MKINMMCGSRNFGEGWYNVDKANPLNDIHSDDIYLKNIPAKSIDLIYCSHGLAYFSSYQATALIKRWREVLKPGRTLRLATPNWDVIRTFEDPLTGPIYGIMKPFSSPEIQHKTIYTEKSLTTLLEECGFKNIRRWNFRHTEHAHFDDHSKAHWPHDSEAIKTGVFTDKHTLISLNLEADA